MFRRIPEAMPAFLPVPALIILVIAVFFGDQIFHLVHEGIMDPSSANYDAIIAGKKGFLNKPFFYIRLVFNILAFGMVFGVCYGGYLSRRRNWWHR
ncbi:MAG: hypothetical protein R2822_06335 [Spirosomataceae bacterium]